MTTASASWNFSRKRMSSMQVSRGRPHMPTSYQRGRGNDPVVVLGRIRSAVAVNMSSPPPHCTSTVNFCEACQDLFAAGKELLVQFHSAAHRLTITTRQSELIDRKKVLV